MNKWSLYTSFTAYIYKVAENDYDNFNNELFPEKKVSGIFYTFITLR